MFQFVHSVKFLDAAKGKLISFPGKDYLVRLDVHLLFAFGK